MADQAAAQLDEDVEYLAESSIHAVVEATLGEVLVGKPEEPLQHFSQNVLTEAIGRGAFDATGSLEGILDVVTNVVKARKLSENEKAKINALQAAIFDSQGNYARPASSNRGRKNLKKLVQTIKDEQTKSTLVKKYQMNQAVSQSSKAAGVLLEVCLEMCSNQVDHVMLLKTLMEGSSRLLSADRCTFFLVENGELTAKVAEGLSEGQEIRIPIGTGLAGSVAKTGETINIADAHADPRFNKTVDLKTGYHTQSLICCPVMYQGSVIAVAQLLNKVRFSDTDEVDESASILEKDIVPFTDEDRVLFEAFSSFAGMFLANSYQFRQVMLEKRKNEVLLDVVQRVNKTDINDFASVSEVIKHGCTELLLAERCTLFLVDKEAGMLDASSEGTNIRMPMDQGIAGFVCSSGETVNIPDAYCDPRFNPDVDHQTGYVTKTILCMPVVAGGEVVAVAQVINKSGGEFVEEDEEMLRFFVTFAGMQIANATLLEFCRASREETMKLLSAAHSGGMGGGAMEIENIATEAESAAALGVAVDPDEIEVLHTPDFNAHLYPLKSDNNKKLISFAVYLFDKMGYLERFHVPKVQLGRFILTCFAKYRHVPYHNAVHAFDVFQITTYFLAAGARHLVTDLEGFILMLSAIVHDVDHMGLNNSFHSKTETPLGLLSNASGASSVLEVHHCNVAIAMLQSEGINLFEHLGKEDSVEAFKLLISNVLHTDMAKHADLTKAYTKMSEEGFDKGNVDHRKLLCGIIMKAADLSNLARPFNVSRLWGIAINTEFYLQGDSERASGKSVTPGFDRNTKQELAQGQVNFIKFCGRGFFQAVADGVLGQHGMAFLVDNIDNNYQKWQLILGE
eukprot:TRINITY_DN16528_c0_g1_i1.p1 TRINITY_DN16528_c0_g1~~TRINITY_DN16528_c0_g1_i1.p1  ORF type:complete len:852 (+),score=358.09 TRINITY_DN16528_c0_g1_i1:70-2625(+)